MAITLKSLAMAARVTARIAAFMPGASPPLVNIPMQLIFLIVPLLYVVLTRCKSTDNSRKRLFRNVLICALFNNFYRVRFTHVHFYRTYPPLFHIFPVTLHALS